MKNKKIKGALLTLLAAVVGAAILLTPSPVAAFDGGSGAGSGGGGGGGGSWGAITRWNYVNTWDQLVNAKFMQSNMNSQGAAARNAAEAAEWFVRTSSGGQGLLDMCKGPNLVRIYYLGADGGIPIKPNSSTGTFRWTNPAGGDSVDQFAGSLNGAGVYVICVINPTERITKNEVENRPRADATTIDGIVAWNTSVSAPLTTQNKGVDPIGEDNLGAQPLVSKESNFGRLVREIAKSGRGDYLNKLVELQEAISRDASESHAAVQLNEGNQAGIAEGGVLDVTEHTVVREVALEQNWSESRSRRYTCDYKPGTNGTQLASPANCIYESWSGWSEDRDSRSHNVVPRLTTPENTAFWQILSVHCNPEELEAALANYGVAGRDYNIVSQTRTDEGVTTVVHTKAVKPFPGLGDAKLFGYGNVNNLALARTADTGFYDKHCAIQCLSDPAGAGASDKNGATKNAGTSSNRNDGYSKGGALYGDSNANYFEMFRDNDPRRVTVNMSYPKVDGTAFEYDGSAPIATTVSLWHGSTPRTFLDPKTGGGLLTVNAVNGSGPPTKLFEGSVAPTTQTNFTDPKRVQSFSGPWATKLQGPYRAFDIASTWASDTQGPAVLNIKWEYQPTTQVTYPSTVGVNSDGSASVATSTRPQKIDVDCYAVFGSNDSAPAQYDAARDTGSDSTNKVDRDILDAGMANGAAAPQNEHNLVIRFVRGVAE